MTGQLFPAPAEPKHGTSIEWTHGTGYKGETWNPQVGCHKVSTGCLHCYAEELHRTRLSGKGGYPEFKPWSALNQEHNVVMLPARLDQPLRWARARMVFVNSMSDMFHERIPVDYIAQVFAVMALTPRHIYQVLTKRPERMEAVLNSQEFRDRLYHHVFGGGETDAWAKARVNMTGLQFRVLLNTYPLPNVWLGTTIENRKWVGRADYLRGTPAAVRFISAEPLLGPLVPPALIPGADGFDVHPPLYLGDIDWLIVGGESGAKHRPIDPGWVRDLLAACLGMECGVCEDVRAAGGEPPQCEFRPAFFLKQWGGRTPKAGGRELDGRTWDEYPPSVRAGR